MSHEIMLSEMDLFKKIQFQGSIESSQIVQFRPISTITDASTIEFDIPIASDEYLDLQNIFICIKGRIVKQDNTNYFAIDDNRYSLINYAVNSIFDQLAIYLNGTLVSQSSKTHHYMAIIQALLEYNIMDAFKSLASGGFARSYGDDNYDHSEIDPVLFSIVRRSKNFTLYGKLHGDIFKIDRMMLNGITLHLALSRAPNQFVLRGSPAVAAVPAVGGAPAVAALEAVEPKLDLRDCCIFARKVKPYPNSLTAHVTDLHNNKAIYPFKRTNIKVLNLPANQSAFTLDNIYMNQMPCKLILGLVSNNALRGVILQIHLSSRAIIYHSSPYTLMEKCFLKHHSNRIFQLMS